MKLSLSEGLNGGVHVGVADGGAANEVEASGLALDLGPDGSLRARAGRLVLRNLRLQAGPLTVEIAQATLSGATFVLRQAEVTALAADELQLQGVKLVSNAAPDRALAPEEPWRLDAIGGLDGMLHAYVTEAAWKFDAEIRVPIASGRIRFDRVVVEHIGPNSSMGLSDMGVYVDAPGGSGRIYLVMFGAAHVPGAAFEQRGSLFGSRVTDRGALALQPFAECLLHNTGGTPIAQLAHHVQGTFDRTRLAGELRLGDGAIGTTRHHVMLADRARGKNRVSLSATVLSHQLVLRWPELSASGATFEMFGRQGSTGPITGTLSVHASGLGAAPGRKPVHQELVLIVGELTLRRLVLGDVAAEAGLQAPLDRAVNAR